MFTHIHRIKPKNFRSCWALIANADQVFTNYGTSPPKSIVREDSGTPPALPCISQGASCPVLPSREGLRPGGCSLLRCRFYQEDAVHLPPSVPRQDCTRIPRPHGDELRCPRSPGDARLEDAKSCLQPGSGVATRETMQDAQPPSAPSSQHWSEDEKCV